MSTPPRVTTDFPQTSQLGIRAAANHFKFKKQIHSNPKHLKLLSCDNEAAFMTSQRNKKEKRSKEFGNLSFIVFEVAKAVLSV